MSDHDKSDEEILSDLAARIDSVEHMVKRAAGGFWYGVAAGVGVGWLTALLAQLLG